MDECLDADRGPCAGDTFPRYALSGSGLRYPRCDKHYVEYAARLQPRIDDINRRYPVQPPDDFDPMAIGEVWSEEDY